MRCSDKKRKLILLKKTSTGGKITKKISRFRIRLDVYVTKSVLQVGSYMVFKFTLDTLSSILVSFSIIMYCKFSAESALTTICFK